MKINSAPEEEEKQHLRAICLWVGLSVCKPKALQKHLRISEPQQHLAPCRARLIELGNEAWLGILEARIFT